MPIDNGRFFDKEDFVMEIKPPEPPVVSIIVAMDERCGIGKNGDMPWRNPLDMRRFRRITTGHPVIMGRKTYESIPGHVLKKRTNIVLSEKLAPWDVVCDGDRVIGVGRYAEAVQEAKKSPGSDEIFVIGGAQVYERALPTVDRLYITMVYGDHGCDVFFPNIFDALAHEEAWALVDAELVPDDHAFFIYQRFTNGNS